MRKILENALRHLDLDLTEVLHTANGIEALEALEMSIEKDQPLDLVLCDVHMPTMNGLDFLLEKQRRNLAPAVPVVMITADATDPQVLQAVAAGAQSYIAKPFTLVQIQACVESLLHITAAPRDTGGPPW
jgi:two-component system chemotaxis response regulator CheY